MDAVVHIIRSVVVRLAIRVYHHERPGISVAKPDHHQQVQEQQVEEDLAEDLMHFDFFESRIRTNSITDIANIQ